MKRSINMSPSESNNSLPVDLFVEDALPGYPEDLHPYPENYTIYLPSDKYNPVEKIAEQEMSA